MGQFPKSCVALRGFYLVQCKMNPDLAGICVWICAAMFARPMRQERVSKGNMLQPSIKCGDSASGEAHLES